MGIFNACGLNRDRAEYSQKTLHMMYKSKSDKMFTSGHISAHVSRQTPPTWPKVIYYVNQLAWSVDDIS